MNTGRACTKPVWPPVYRDDLAHFTAAAATCLRPLALLKRPAQTGREVCEVAPPITSWEHLSLTWFLQQINALPSASRWEALARRACVMIWTGSNGR